MSHFEDCPLEPLVNDRLTDLAAGKAVDLACPLGSACMRLDEPTVPLECLSALTALEDREFAAGMLRTQQEIGLQS